MIMIAAPKPSTTSTTRDDVVVAHREPRATGDGNPPHARSERSISTPPEVLQDTDEPQRPRVTAPQAPEEDLNKLPDRALPGWTLAFLLCASMVGGNRAQVGRSWLCSNLKGR